jgi:hypothetical protein
MSMDGPRPDSELAAQVIDLSQVGAAQLAERLDDALYLLGVNGPLGPDDIGHIDRFVWRFALLRMPGRPPALLAFSTMPRLMAFTRVLNSAQPFAVPTEARRQRLGSAAAGIPFLLLVDPDPESCASASRGSATAERVIPELDR